MYGLKGNCALLRRTKDVRVRACVGRHHVEGKSYDISVFDGEADTDKQYSNIVWKDERIER